MIWEELNEALIIQGMKAESSDDVMRQLGGVLTREGYGKDSYVNALIEREREFPTGLDLGEIGVAIPHTAVSHVKKEGIGIAVLDQPVAFCQMGGDDEKVDVSLVFMLSILDAQGHLDQLQKILAIIQDQEVLKKILKAENAKQLITVIKEKENTL